MTDQKNGSGDQILRVEKNRNYKTLNLHAIADDADLSWKAVGLLSYLLSRPDNWSFNRSDIIRRHSDGRRAVQSGLQELEDAGYLEREQLRSEGGHFQYRWTVYERPGVGGDTKRAPAEARSPSTDDPSTDTVPHSSEESSKEEVTSTEAKASGRRPDVENSRNGDGWNARLAPLIREVAYNGDGPPPGHDLPRCMSKAKELLSKGYTVEDLEDAIHGLRDMADRKHPQVRDWIAPEDRFTMLAFGRAEERGQKLVQLAAAHHRKHADVEVTI